MIILYIRYEGLEKSLESCWKYRWKLKSSENNYTQVKYKYCKFQHHITNRYDEYCLKHSLEHSIRFAIQNLIDYFNSKKYTNDRCFHGDIYT